MNNLSALFRTTLSFLPAFALIIFITLAPDVTLAAPGGFVTCEGAGCSACDLIKMVNKIIVWLFGMIFLIFAVLMMMAGFGLVTSGGDTSAVSAAKSKFQNALIGLLIVMAAWLLVDTMVRKLVNGGNGDLSQAGFKAAGPWAEVKCQVQTVPLPPKPQPVGGVTATSSTDSMPTSCLSGICIPIGIPCSNSASCKISPHLVQPFQSFHAAAGVSGARVTEAMPPTRTHVAACHYDGTCIDYSKQGGMTPAEIIRVINAANANRLRPVYEVGTASEKDALVKGGAPAGNILVVSGWISGPHFSIYSSH